MRIFQRVFKNERGISLVFFALTMFVILFLMGLCIDVGYLYVVKGELQNAADAGALAGAGTIFPQNPPTAPTSFPKPAFEQAHTVAKTFVEKSKAAGDLLTEGEIESIETGYWNLRDGQGPIQGASTVPSGICSGSGMACTSDADCPAGACMIQDVPAVLVTVKKTVPTFFASAFGFNSFEPRASAVAARGFPKTGHPFPIAVSKCMVQHYFAQDPLPDPPAEITMTGPYSHVPEYSHVPGCNTGQWTSLNLGSSSASVIKDLMYGVTTPLEIGDDITIAPGDKEVLYGDVQNFLGKVVLLSVVQDPALNTNTTTPITGFVRFRINGVTGTGANTRIVGNFLAYYEDKETGKPGGPRGNSVTPPVLVK